MQTGIRKIDYLLLLALAGTLLILILPGSTVWLGDESRLLGEALNANTEGRLATKSIIGSSWVAYGPPVVWLNQLLLLLTHNPVVIAAVKCLLSVSLAWWGILRLARRLGFSPGAPAALYFCAPYVYFYCRMPWDNVWLMPLGLLFVSCLAGFFRSGKFREAAGMATLLTIMILIHPIALVIGAGTALTLLLLRWKRLLREWWKFLLAGAAALAVLLPYFLRIQGELVSRAGAPLVMTVWEKLAGLLIAFRNLSPFEFTAYFGGFTLPWYLAWIEPAGFAAVGLLTLAGAVAAVRNFRSGQADVFDETAVAALAVYGCYFAGLLLLSYDLQMHYHSVVLAFLLVLAWRGWLELRAWRRPWAVPGLAVLAAAELALSLHFLLMMETNGGTPSPRLGATLERQWEVAQSLTAARRSNPGLAVGIEVESLVRDPFPLAVLIRLAFDRELPPSPVYRRALLRPSADGYGIELWFDP